MNLNSVAYDVAWESRLWSCVIASILWAYVLAVFWGAKAITQSYTSGKPAVRFNLRMLLLLMTFVAVAAALVSVLGPMMVLYPIGVAGLMVVWKHFEKPLRP